jgi:hypothetical protein
VRTVTDFPLTVAVPVLTVAATAGVAAGADDEEEDGLDEAEDDDDEDDEDDVVVTEDVSDVELPHAAMSRTPPPISSRRAANLGMVTSNEHLTSRYPPRLHGCVYAAMTSRTTLPSASRRSITWRASPARSRAKR